jgi:phosphonate transport system substrate-binding protein
MGGMRFAQFVGRAALALVVVFAAACGSSAPAGPPIKSTVVMGFVPSQTTSVVQTNADLIAQYLSKKTGYTVESHVLTSYAAVTEGMTSNQVDIGWVGPLDYVIAHKKNGAEAVTKSVRNGVAGYKAFIIVNKASGIRSVQDLKGKKFAFGDPLSTSSNLVPRYAMKQAGMNPDSDVRGVNISNQSQIAINVCQGVVDAGAIYDDARKNAGVDTSCPGVMDKTQIIYTSDLIPGDPQMLRHNLNSEQKKKLRDAMVALGSDPSMKDPLKSLYTIDALVPASDGDYKFVRDLVQNVKPELLNG